MHYFALTTLNSICHFLIQSTSLVRLLCNSLQSAFNLTVLSNFVLSANFAISEFTPFSRSLVSILNSTGPSTDPQGTLVSLLHGEKMHPCLFVFFLAEITLLGNENHVRRKILICIKLNKSSAWTCLSKSPIGYQAGNAAQCLNRRKVQTSLMHNLEFTQQVFCAMQVGSFLLISWVCSCVLARWPPPSWWWAIPSTRGQWRRCTTGVKCLGCIKLLFSPCARSHSPCG